MLNPRENFLAVLRHETADYVPDEMSDVIMVGGAFETFENGPFGGGYDDFGLKWLCTASGSGQAVPDPACHPIPDILEWKKYLKLPDLDKYDWEGMAAMQFAGTDRNQKLVEYGTWNAQFLRMSHLLGFENGLCAMYEEPEACYDLMDAITDYKCKLVDYIVKYFNPDVITNYDDVATERGLFMSPEIYRSLVKPLHKKFIDKVKSYDIMHFQHCCGKCEDIMQDFIDEGSVAWTAAQPLNDIVGIIEKYGDRLTVIGGYDTNGVPGRPDASEEEIEKEVLRMLETYSGKGSYATMGFLLVNSSEPTAFLDGVKRIGKHINKHRYNYK